MELEVPASLPVEPEVIDDILAGGPVPSFVPPSEEERRAKLSNVVSLEVERLKRRVGR